MNMSADAKKAWRDGPSWRDDPPSNPAGPAVPDWLDIAGALAHEPPALDFVLPGYVAGSVGSIVAAGATGKTMLALQIAVHVSGGADTLRLADVAGWQPTFGRVLYLSGEDPADVIAGRLHAIGTYMPDAEARQRVQTNLRIAPLVGFGARIDHLDWRVWIEREATGARLVIIDTLRRFHGADENDGGAMAELLSHLERICRTAGTSIVFLHHVSKASALNGGAGEQQASRGSSVLSDNVRWQANLSTMAEKEAKAAGVPDALRRRFVRLAFPKLNYGPPQPDLWFSREKGGVLRPAPQIAAAAAGAQGVQAARAARKRGGSKGSSANAAGAGSDAGLNTLDADGNLPMADIEAAIKQKRKEVENGDDDNW
ncbi:MAG: helicase RepA family protein [Rhodospirillales bacterium]|nr:helicase RepA family protein [Rhodospirillales bacterium]